MIQCLLDPRPHTFAGASFVWGVTGGSGSGSGGDGGMEACWPWSGDGDVEAWVVWWWRLVMLDRGSLSVFLSSRLWVGIHGGWMRGQARHDVEGLGPA